LFKELYKKLITKDAKYITLETTPPHEPQFKPIIDRIAELKLQNLVDGFTTTDSPLAKMKYSSIFGAMLLQQRFLKPSIATISMRDRNKIALQSDLLGANEVDVRAILALTGDPASISDQPNTKGVVEADSTLLLDIIECFNSGIDYAGKPFKIPPKEILSFAVTNSFAKNPKTLYKKLLKKIRHGAKGIITQPIYQIQNAQLLLELLEEANNECCKESKKAHLILGVFPITKLRTAQFLASHVPGINVPKHWIEELRLAKTAISSAIKGAKDMIDKKG
jgi:5,10-methylenetetrahydrofolate reductase